ncbi:MAG: HIT family protein [Proteobacteria bacterium]|nr:MAG: HIT family protein [Pseudomonadota bacterium]
MKTDCIFCKIIAGEVPSFKIYEDDETYAFMDIHPVHPGHALVVPKTHAADVFEVSEEAIVAAARTARRVARAVNEIVRPDGMNLLQCNGKAAAQSVLHLHIHVLPRADGDDAPLNWELKPGDMDDIGQLAEKIRARIE